MADDIKISSGNSQSAAGQTPPANQQTGSQPAGDQLNPVIDLRNMDQKPAQNAATVPPASSAAPAAQTPAAAVPAPAPAQGRRASSSSFLLGEEDESAPAPIQEKYSIPSVVTEKFPDLIQLIKQTESMNDEERDYWFQILPIMTEDQIKKFRDILVNEKSQLTNLDQEYEQELTKLNEKHMIEWKEFETKEKRKTLTTAEQTSKQNEQSEQEALLKRLSQI